MTAVSSSLQIGRIVNFSITIFSVAARFEMSDRFLQASSQLGAGYAFSSDLNSVLYCDCPDHGPYHGNYMLQCPTGTFAYCSGGSHYALGVRFRCRKLPGRAFGAHAAEINRMTSTISTNILTSNSPRRQAHRGMPSRCSRPRLGTTALPLPVFHRGSSAVSRHGRGLSGSPGGGAGSE